MNKLIIPSSLTMAMVVCFGLFAFMAKLITPPQVTIEEPTSIEPTILFELTDTNPNIDKQPKVLPKKPKATPPPPRQVVEVQQQQTTAATTPNIDSSTFRQSIGMSAHQGGSKGLDKPILVFGGNDNEGAPIIRVTPQYPIEAACKGIEGWVKLSFSIDTDGSVTNIQVMDSSPKRTFDRAARKALKAWRYKAKFVNSVPVMQHNLQVQLDFEMEK